MPRYRLKEEQRVTNSATASLGIIVGKTGQEVIIIKEYEDSSLVVVKNKKVISHDFDTRIKANTPYYETWYHTLRSNIEEIPEDKTKISVYSPSDKKIDNEPFYCGKKLNVIAETLNRFRRGQISMQDAYDTIVNDAILSKIFGDYGTDED